MNGNIRTTTITQLFSSLSHESSWLSSLSSSISQVIFQFNEKSRKWQWNASPNLKYFCHRIAMDISTHCLMNNKMKQLGRYLVRYQLKKSKDLTKILHDIITLFDIHPMFTCCNTDKKEQVTTVESVWFIVSVFLMIYLCFCLFGRHHTWSTWMKTLWCQNVCYITLKMGQPGSVKSVEYHI